MGFPTIFVYTFTQSDKEVGFAGARVEKIRARSTRIAVGKGKSTK
jgi:hypothetical protein